MSPRVYERKFDWDEARARHAAGESYKELAREFGVSTTAVQRVCDDALRARMDAASRAWIAAGNCPECGAPATRAGGQRRCRDCAMRRLATSVRHDAILCFGCRLWKADEDFPFDRHPSHRARRQRHSYCRVCQTAARREYRERRKVPCAVCGAPALPPNEKKTNGAPYPRCRPCYLARRTPEQVAA